MKHLMKFPAILVSLLLVTSCEKLDPNAPEACFLVPGEIEAGVPAAFSSSCSVNAVEFAWNFGDGETSTEANPTHTYAGEGTYSVTLTVSNGQGKSDQTTLVVQVQPPSIIEHSGAITSDETWIEGTHLVTSDVYVNGAILTIAPGATILFASNTGLYIGYSSGFSGATLIAEGTQQAPITFTSAAATKTPGDWDFIGFYDGASKVSSMEHCIVEYGGGYSENYGEIHVDGSAVSIQNSIVRYSGAFGLSLTDDGYFTGFTGNTLQENTSNPVSIYANNAHTLGTGNTISTATGILVRADEIDREDATWVKQTCAFVINGDIYVQSVTGAQLTLMPGVELRMGKGSGIYVGYGSGKFGTLVAEGTPTERITFTSSAPTIARSPGDWDFLGFYDGAGNSSSLAYCDFSFGGGYSGSYGMIHLDGAGVSMTHATIRSAENIGITLRDDGYFTGFENNVFENNGTFPVEIYGNHVHTLGAGNDFGSAAGILVEGDDMEQADATWLKHNVPYIIDGTLNVQSSSGARLTIDPGTVVKFTENSELRVGYSSGKFGVLIADGEPGNRITFTSSAAAGFEAAGDWDGIWFDDGTGNGSVLDHCLISFGGGYSNNSGNVLVRNKTAGVPVISNCQIEHSAAYGIYLASGASPTLTDNIFGNNALGDTNQ